MKGKLILLFLALTLGFLILPSALAQLNSIPEEEIALPPDQDMEPDQGYGPPGTPYGPGYYGPQPGGRGMPRGNWGRRSDRENMESGPGYYDGPDEPGYRGGRGWGGPSDAGSQRGFGDRMRLGRMNPEELLNFLRQYEPALAKSLDKLRADDMDAYRRKMFAMMRLYGPVMREMQFNPDLGKISLANIRLRLEIEQDVNKYKTVGDKKEKEQIKAQLTDNVGQLFDSILNREGLRLKSFQQRLEGWNAPPGLDSDAGSGRPGMGRDRRSGGRGGFGRGPREERGRDIHGRLDERKKQIEDWRKHKEDIVNARVAVLLQGTKPFPWE